MAYWLMKCEPSVYSIEDLERDKTCYWEGVRNYQARNFLRDSIKQGDKVLFYHSGNQPYPGVYGTAKVIRSGYADHTAWDKNSPYYDPKSSRDHPIWYMVDIAFLSRFLKPVSLKAMKASSTLRGMLVVKPGIRLSVQPVESHHFLEVERMGQRRN